MSETRHMEKGQSGPDTLELLLTHRAQLTPNKQALCDPPNRNRLEGRSDNMVLRTFTYQSLERAVTRLANRFLSLDLEQGDYVALQLPNFAETPILVLALMRAGFVPCLIPLSWTFDEISRSFERLNPKAVICCGQIEGVNYSEHMRMLAFSNLNIRFMMGVGYEIAEGLDDLTPLFDPQTQFPPQEHPLKPHQSELKSLSLVTYTDATTPVPHTNGQILAAGLLHVLELSLCADDHILSAYPLSSIPGLAAHFYPWLMSGCALTLHQPFDFSVLQTQLQTKIFSYFATPSQVVDHLIEAGCPLPQKLGIVRRDRHLPTKCDLSGLETQLFEIWNLGGLGSLPVRIHGEQSAGLFVHGQICLPEQGEKELCLAAARITDDRLYIKGRIFPDTHLLETALEWISLKNRLDRDWLDTGLKAFHGPDGSILLGGSEPISEQKLAS